MEVKDDIKNLKQSIELSQSQPPTPKRIAFKSKTVKYLLVVSKINDFRLKVLFTLRNLNKS